MTFQSRSDGCCVAQVEEAEQVQGAGADGEWLDPNSLLPLPLPPSLPDLTEVAPTVRALALACACTCLLCGGWSEQTPPLILVVLEDGATTANRPHVNLLTTLPRIHTCCIAQDDAEGSGADGGALTGHTPPPSQLGLAEPVPEVCALVVIACLFVAIVRVPFITVPVSAIINELCRDWL
jgi:hypothetical protein